MFKEIDEYPPREKPTIFIDKVAGYPPAEKQSVCIAKHKTSVSLEPMFIALLDQYRRRDGVETRAKYVSEFFGRYNGLGNFSTGLRMHLLERVLEDAMTLDRDDPELLAISCAVASRRHFTDKQRARYLARIDYEANYAATRAARLEARENSRTRVAQAAGVAGATAG